jgi:glyoxylase-like metal-dependent hydrolase (beta-lactamase superfamily II)
MPPRIELLDLDYQGHPGLIASFLVFGPDGHVLVESGPGSTLSALVAGLDSHGLAPADIDTVFLTHIHLDHAGSAGWWAQQGSRVCVHERGAPHLIEPSRLIGSARRIYGTLMETLWGDILPAPRERVRATVDGDVVEAAGLEFRAIYTPGHAGHHHAWRVGEVAFVGDAMGIRGGAIPWLDLPAPPPEFDRELWLESLGKLREEGLRTIYRTQFGPRADVAEEIDRVAELVESAAAKVRSMLETGLERDEMIARYSEWMNERARREGYDPAVAVGKKKLNPRDMSVDGIARYWRKKAESRASRPARPA